MSTSSQSYKELSIPYFKEVFIIVDEILKNFGIPYYLIGANAIALELLQNDKQPGRGTKDIDFAIMISSMDEYDKVGDKLIQNGFVKVKAPYTFYYQKDNVVVDLLPFGEIEQKDTEDFIDRRTELHLLGLSEVIEDAKAIPIDGDTLSIPPLPGMVLLKLVSWSDRPEERDNDLGDILKVIEHYYDLSFDTIAEEHHDLLDSENEFDELLISAEALGRDARKYLIKSEEFNERIQAVLSDNLSSDKVSKITMYWSRILDKDIEYCEALLKAFQRGVTGT